MRRISRCGPTCSALTSNARILLRKCSECSTPEFCERTINEVSIIQDDLRANLGTTFAFLGDEIYLRAGRSVPSRNHYGDYPQIEDGIGMVRSFAAEFE